MTTQRAPQSFSWGRLIHDMNLTGVPALIACHCEPTHYDASQPLLQLQLMEGLQAFTTSPSMGKLKNALIDFFGENLKLDITSGPANRSPAALAGQKKIGEQADAMKILMGDKSISEMIEQFGAKIVIDTVEPIKGSLKPR